MKNFEYYRSLPDSLQQGIIESEIEEVIASSNADFKIALSCIYELSDRQVINYSSISNNLKEKLSAVLIGKWSSLPMSDMLMCMEIMLNLGLQEFYDFLKINVAGTSHADVIKEFLEIVDEFGDNIEDVSFRN